MTHSDDTSSPNVVALFGPEIMTYLEEAERTQRRADAFRAATDSTARPAPSEMASLHYVDEGAAPTRFVVHGNPTSLAAELRSLAQNLLERVLQAERNLRAGLTAEERRRLLGEPHLLSRSPDRIFRQLAPIATLPTSEAARDRIFTQRFRARLEDLDAILADDVFAEDRAALAKRDSHAVGRAAIVDELAARRAARLSGATI